MLLSVATAQNDEEEGGDVDNAYLYREIAIDIYICRNLQTPPGKKENPGFVCKLLILIYRAKQADGIWGIHAGQASPPLELREFKF